MEGNVNRLLTASSYTNCASAMNFFNKLAKRSGYFKDKLCPQFSNTSDMVTSLAASFICSPTSGPKNLQKSQQI